MDVREREVQVYIGIDGKSPFEKWLNALRDKKTKARIFQPIDRLRLGNFDDCRSVGEGVYELRVHLGLLGSQVVLLLCGGDTSSQEKDIEAAQEFWEEHREDEK